MDESATATTTALVRGGLRRAAAAQRLAVSASRPWDRPAATAAILGHLSATVTATDRRLDDLVRGLVAGAAAETVDSVDGPFRDDLPDAVTTARLWISWANAACADLRDALDNAHIALSGLAGSTWTSEHARRPRLAVRRGWWRSGSARSAARRGR